jgi:hypothetical protein
MNARVQPGCKVIFAGVYYFKLAKGDSNQSFLRIDDDK